MTEKGGEGGRGRGGGVGWHHGFIIPSPPGPVLSKSITTKRGLNQPRFSFFLFFHSPFPPLVPPLPLVLLQYANPAVLFKSIQESHKLKVT